MLNVDGQTINYNGNNYLSELVGGSPSTTGVALANVVLQGLSAGTHTLTLGILNNKKTYNSELSILTINSISVDANCPETCPANIIEMDSSVIIYNKNAMNSIETNGSILANSNITYQAGDSILLEQKFEVEPNAIFEAKIEACP